MGDDTDTPNLLRILDLVRSRWNIDATRMLLTGMSDGGTFCYVTGLESASPFTHLAPVVGNLSSADGGNGRCREVARPCRSISCTAGSTGCFRCRWRGRRKQALSAAGADVTYRETRRPQPLLSARDERADPRLAARHMIRPCRHWRVAPDR